MIEREVRQARVSHRLAHLFGRRHRDLVPARGIKARGHMALRGTSEPLEVYTIRL